MVKAPWWEQTPGATVDLINSGKFAQATLITISFASGAKYAPMQFTNDETPAGLPTTLAWSPDSSTLAWVSKDDGKIYTNRADGKGPTFLYDPDPDDISISDLVYSPDGTQIAIIGFNTSNNNGGIWLINSDGSGSPANIVDDADGLGAGIDWNATVNKIAFPRSDDGNIYSVDPDGSNSTQITAVPGGSADSPRWSPDGTQLVYQNFTGSPDFERNINIINADGTGDTLLVRFAPDGFVRKPSWTPNGARVAFTGGQHVVSDGNLAGATNSVTDNIASGLGLWFCNPDGTAVHKWLTTMLKSPSFLLISPDGTKAAWLVLGQIEGGPDASDPADGGLWVVSLALAFRLREEIIGNPAIGPTPPPSNWILAGGIWNDSGVWVDTAAWED